MGKNLHTRPQRDNAPSKVQRNTFNKDPKGEGEGEGRPNPRPFKKNQLKLNQYHQTVNKKQKVSIKKKIRDITRLISKKEALKEGADPSLHDQKEKELKDLKKKQRANRKKKFLTQEYEQKYKKIKFFEETKLKRKLKQTQNKINAIEKGEEVEEDLEELKAAKQRIFDDLEYIKYYPVDRKYVALFPAVDDEESQVKREAMRKHIKEIVAKRAENFQANLERMTENMKEEASRKLDTFFEAEEVEETAAPKKKIVSKTGRIITDDF